MLFRHQLRLIDSSPCCDIPRSTEIGVCRVAALAALKLCLALAVSLLAVPALGTNAGRVAGIDGHQGHPVQLGFIPQERPQLIESPRAMLG